MSVIIRRGGDTMRASIDIIVAAKNEAEIILAGI